MNLYRFISSRFIRNIEDALSGIGAALVGSRWHVKGFSVVHTVTDIETGVKELNFYADRGGLTLKHNLPYFFVQIKVPDLVSRELLQESDLPPEWNNNEWTQAGIDFPSRTQQLGYEWLKAGKTCLLFVPSARVEGKLDCLINPSHRDFAQIKVEELRSFQINEKLEQPIADIHKKTDVFLCHASEDKQLVVDPLAKSLRAAGITCWYDQDEVRWGDSLTGKVNQALSTCQFVIVILSRSFLRKQWPQREWQAALNKEFALGRTFVLPLIVGDEEAKQEILWRTALQNDKMYLVWTGDPDPVVSALIDILTQIQ
jgi:RES domain-containing protein